jgi:hypothetical protein
VLGIFETGTPKLFAQAGPKLLILLISASGVARVIGVSYVCFPVLESRELFAHIADPPDLSLLSG